MSSEDKVYHMEEVKKHCTEKSAWMVIHGSVFDVTDYSKSHPGGMEVLLKFSGKDATSAFEAIHHSRNAREFMQSLNIGKLKTTDNSFFDKNDVNFEFKVPGRKRN